MPKLIITVTCLTLLGCIQPHEFKHVGKDTGKDLPVDTPIDVAVADLPVDTSVDIPVDLPVDVPVDVPVDLPVDVAADVDVVDLLDVTDTSAWDEWDGEDICTPECDGKLCGPDGCGAQCGSCSPGDDPCMENICNEETGQCYEQPVANENKVECTDGNPCTEMGVCTDGECLADWLPTTELLFSDCYCFWDTQCKLFETPFPCDGVFFCNDELEPPRCDVHLDQKLNCDDELPCTADSCDPDVGCQYAPSVELSTEEVTCCIDSDGECAGGDPCVAGACNLETHQCEDIPLGPETACPDDTVCNGDEHCLDGICQAGTPPVCDDSNDCTDDTCDPILGCQYVNNNANFCPDNDACNGEEWCLEGICQPANSLACNDDNGCTDDTCNPDTGCVYTNNNTPCSDGILCTVNDHCDGGTCVAGAPMDCDDGDPCTDDVCDNDDGCIYTANTGEPCEDGDFCTVSDVCVLGLCKGATNPDCETGDFDHDGLPGAQDLCPTAFDTGNLDLDGNGKADACAPLLGDFSFDMALTLTEDGATPAMRRTSEPVELPLRNGIVDASVSGYWRFDQTSIDASFNNHPVTLEQAADYAESMDEVFDHALTCNGFGAMAEVEHGDWMDTDGPFTVMLWLSPEALTGKRVLAGRYRKKPVVDAVFALRLNQGVFTFDLWDQGGTQHSLASLSNAVPGWQHVAATYDGKYVDLYVDGVLDSRLEIGKVTLKTSTVELSFCNTQDGGLDEAYQGLLDEALWFSRALSPEEVEVYARSNHPYGAHLLPGTQADFDDLRIVESGDTGGSFSKRLRVIGPRPHSDTPCPALYAGTPVAEIPGIADRDDLCGVVSWWKLDGDGDDAAGSNHGEVSGVTPVPGRFGEGAGALRFGQDAHVFVPYGYTLDQKKLTVEMWVMLTQEDFDWEPGISFVSRTDNAAWNIGMNDSMLHAAFYIGTGWVADSVWVPVDSSSHIGRWTHLAVTYDGKYASLYVDGQERGREDFDGPVDYGGSPELTIGDELDLGAPSGDHNLRGLIDEVILHSVAKSPDYMFHRANPGVPEARFLARTVINEIPDQGYPFVDYDLHWGSAGATAVMPFVGDNDGNHCYGLLNDCLGYAGWWRLNEGRGTVAVDWSTGKSNGVYTANTVWAAGIEGLAFKGDGQARYALIEDEPRFHVSQGTWEAVFIPGVEWEGPSEQDGRILSKLISGSLKDYGLFIHKDTGKLRFTIEPPGPVEQYHAYSDNDAWAMGQSYQAAVRSGAAGTCLFTNQVQQQDGSEYSGGLYGQGAAITIGAFLEYQEYFDGLLDGFRFMSRALEPDEMLHYPLAGYPWDMDEELFPDGDGDGVADDGDFSGVVGDHPCTGGQVTYCDDNAPDLDNPDQGDLDSDGISDLLDNCPDHYNPDQKDENVNGVGSVCDVTEMDWDHDGLLPADDACPYAFDPGNLDLDQDGHEDACTVVPAGLLHMQTVNLKAGDAVPQSRRTHEVVEIQLRTSMEDLLTLVPGSQADFDDVRVTETPHPAADPEQTGERVIPSRIIGVRPHSDTPCPMALDDGTWADREDLCGVLAYWKLDGDGDDVLEQHPGTIVGGFEAQGRFGDAGGAWQFDGEASRVEVPDSADLMSAQQTTLEAWFRCDKLDGHLQVIATKSQGSGANTLALLITDGNQLAGVIDSVTQSSLLVVHYAIQEGAWHHAAITYDGEDATLYIGGLPMKTTPYSGAISFDDGLWSIGRHSADTGFYFNGVIDEVIVHSVAKSPDYIYHRARPGRPAVRFLSSTSVNEVEGVGFPYREYRLYAGKETLGAALPLVGRADGTRCYGLLSDCMGYAGWWRFEEGVGKAVTDSSTGKNTGLLLPANAPPTWVAGISGYGLELDGSNQYVDFGPMEGMSGHAQRTVEVAVSASGAVLENEECYGNKLLDKSGNEGDFFMASEPPATVYFQGADNDDNDPGGVLSAEDVLDGMWRSVAVVLGPVSPDSTGAMYVDAGPVSEGVPESPDTTAPLYLGFSSSEWEPHQCHFKGQVDSVRVMNRALAPDELLHFPEGQATLACIPHCEGKECGNDGCGASCGSCAEAYACDADFQCVVAMCPPLCEGDDVDHDGLSGDDDACPYEWDPDNLDYDDDGYADACEPVTTISGLPFSRTIELSVLGVDSDTRRTHQPVEIPLVNGILDDSVLGYWPLDGDGLDVMGKHHGAASGTAAAQGVFLDAGGALDFAAEGAKVEIPDDGSLSGLKTFAVMCWFKPSPSAGDFEVIIGKGNNTDLLPSDSYYLILEKFSPGIYRLSVRIEALDGSVGLDTGPAIQDEEWHHGALAFDGGRTNLFLDGHLAASAVWEGIMDSTDDLPLIIGGHSGGEWFSGAVDEVLLFSRALSPDEISAYVASFSPYGTSLVPGSQADFDDVRITETGDSGAGAVKRARIVGVRPHADTPCPYDNPMDAPALADRDDLCGVEALWKLDGNGQDVLGIHDGNSMVSPPSVTGRFGDSDGAFWFDGMVNYLDFAVPQPIEWSADGFTAEAWIRVMPGAQKNYGTIIAMSESNEGGEWFSFNVSANGTLMFGWDSVTTPYPLAFSDNEVDDGGWHHVAAVMKNKEVTIYVDGLPDGFMSSSKWKDELHTEVTGALRSGYAKTGLEHRFEGTIDDLVVHTVAKSPDYVFRRANPGLPKVQFLANTGATAVDGVFPAREYRLWWGDPAAEAHLPFVGDGDGQGGPGDCYGLLNRCMGYVGWWRFDEGNRYSWVTDDSANGLTGMFKGSQYWEATGNGLGRHFDGQSNWVDIPYDPVMNVQEFTLETYALVDQWADNLTIIAQDNEFQSSAYRLATKAYDGIYMTWKTAAGETEGLTNDGDGFAQGDWTHVAGTYDGATSNLHVNGKVEGHSPSAGPVGSQAGLMFGANMGSGKVPENFFQGVLDFVRIMNRALEPDELLRTPPFGWLLGVVE